MPPKSVSEIKCGERPQSSFLPFSSGGEAGWGWTRTSCLQLASGEPTGPGTLVDISNREVGGGYMVWCGGKGGSRIQEQVRA